MNELTEKELRFCKAYQACGNGTEAYLYASRGEVTRESAATQSSDWLSRVEIAQKIKELRDVEMCQQQILIHESQEQSLKTGFLLLEFANKLGAAISRKLPDLDDPNFLQKTDKLRPSELNSLASAMSDCCSILREVRTLQLEFSGLTYLIDNADKLVKKEPLN